MLDKEQIIRQENSQDEVIDYGILEATEGECLLKQKPSLVKKHIKNKKPLVKLLKKMYTLTSVCRKEYFGFLFRENVVGANI